MSKVEPQGQLTPTGFVEVRHEVTPHGAVIQEFLPARRKRTREARRLIKASLRPERIHAIAQTDGMAQYETGGLEDHYMNTGLTILRMDRQLEERRIRNEIAVNR